MPELPADGGPAFPRSGYYPDNLAKLSAEQRDSVYNAPSDGMSLFQWYAGQALVGLVQSLPKNPTTSDMAKVAKASCDMAQAMIDELNVAEASY